MNPIQNGQAPNIAQIFANPAQNQGVPDAAQQVVNQLITSFLEFQKNNPSVPPEHPAGGRGYAYATKLKEVLDNIDKQQPLIPGDEKKNFLTNAIVDHGGKCLAALGALLFGAAKAEVGKQAVGMAKDAIPNFEFFQEKHGCDVGGMRRFKELLSTNRFLALKGATACAASYDLDCMGIDVDAFNMLKIKDIRDASIFYIECLKHDTPQCSWATSTVFSEIANIDAEAAGKVAQQCAAIPSNGCSQIDVRAFNTLVEKDASEALIFAQECADKPTVQCSTLGKQAHDSLEAKSASKAAALKKKCENITTSQCVEITQG